MVKDETQSVRISKDVVRQIKLNVALHGGTIRSVLEAGSVYGMRDNLQKSKKKK